MQVEVLYGPEITTEEKEAFISEALASPVLAFDLETQGLDPYQDEVLMMQIALPSGRVLVDAMYPDVPLPESLRHALQTSIVYGHNLKFDAKFMARYYQTHLGRVWDTMIAESTLNLGRQVRVGLESVALRRLGMNMRKGIRRNFIGRKDRNFTDEEVDYGARDVYALFPIVQQQLGEIEMLGLNRIMELENQAVLTTAQMELEGLGFDRELWQRLIERYEARLYQIVLEIYTRHAEWSGKKKPVHFGLFVDTRTKTKALVSALNLNSNQQNLLDLYAMGYSPENTDAFHLKQISSDSWFARDLLRYREANKMVSTYLYPLLDMVNPVTGKVHFDYRQLSTFDRTGKSGTVTGRYSCKRFQQIPADAELRAAFLAPEGYQIATIDMSNIELRIAGNQTGDKAIIDFFLGNVQEIPVYRMAYPTEQGEHKQFFRSVEEAQQVARQAKDSGVKGITLKRVMARVTDYHGYMVNKTFPHIPLSEAVNIEIEGHELPTLHPKVRKLQKILNFAAIYLVTEHGLAKQLANPHPETLRQLLRRPNGDTMSLEDLAELASPEILAEAQLQEARQILANYNKALPRLMGGLKAFGQQAVRERQTWDRSLGRIRWFDPDVPDWKVEKAGANMPVQGTSANGIKKAMTLLHGWVLGTVHDEVLIKVRNGHLEEDVSRAEAALVEAANFVLPGPIPYTVGTKVAPHWTK